VFEDLADLYLRLNGYFTVKNFFQHPKSSPPSAETDIDILALRLPHEREITGDIPDMLPHHPAIVDSRQEYLAVVIAEAKGRPDSFNEKWFTDAEVLRYTLRRVGFTSSESYIDEVAQRLRARGRAAGDAGGPWACDIRLVLFSDFCGVLPLEEALVIPWSSVLDFLRARYDLLRRAASRTPVKRGVGPLKDSLFGFLYEEAFQKNRLNPSFLRAVWPTKAPYVFAC